MQPPGCSDTAPLLSTTSFLYISGRGGDGGIVLYIKAPKREAHCRRRADPLRGGKIAL